MNYTMQDAMQLIMLNNRVFDVDRIVMVRKYCHTIGHWYFTIQFDNNTYGVLAIYADGKSISTRVFAMATKERLIRRLLLRSVPINAIPKIMDCSTDEVANIVNEVMDQ